MLYVYAPTVRVADRWARERRIRPADFRAYGDRTPYTAHGRVFARGDRVAIVGDISQQLQLAVDRCVANTPPGQRPRTERFP